MSAVELERMDDPRPRSIRFVRKGALIPETYAAARHNDLDNFLPSDAPLLNRCTIGEAVAESLRMLGMEQKLKISQHGETYEAGLSLHRRPRTFASLDQVGFGISQVLPLIALGLLSPPGSLLVFEQPELHLHPRAQAGLADLLLVMARLGRRFLIETHSDHLINRLRLRAAQDMENQIEGQVNILFVRPPNAERSSASVEQAHIDRYGEIDNWPPEFLVESGLEVRALLLAESTKRNRERGFTPPSLSSRKPGERKGSRSESDD